MKKKVERIAGKFAEIISGWNNVEAIILGEAAEIETIDPYFNINLDIYYLGNLLPRNDRKEKLKLGIMLETSLIFPEDKFLVEDLPVRVRYKETARFGLILKRIEDRLWVFRDSGTNMFYRLTRGQVLFSKNDWLKTIQKRLEKPPEDFWEIIMDSTRFSIEFYLNDLDAAVYRNDRLFYLHSAASFIKSMCSFLFAYNKQFEPSSRMLYERVKALSRLPDEFIGRFESFLRHDMELPPKRKREIARLMAKSILSLQYRF